MKKTVMTVLAALVAFVGYAQSEIRVETHNVVAADEQFNVTFIIEGENKPSDFEWNQGDDFVLLWGPQEGRSTSIQIINGKQTKSVQSTYTYVLRPSGTGKFTLPPATAKIKDRTISSRPVQIEVVSGASSSRNQSQSGQQSQRQQAQTGVQDDDIFLALNLSRSDVVVGELSNFIRESMSPGLRVRISHLLTASGVRNSRHRAI